MIDFFSRLDKYMNFKGLNDNKLTVETGLSNGLIGKARKRGALSQDNISKILYKYSDLDANWLFTGEGSMLKVIAKDNTVQQGSHTGGNDELLQEKIAFQSEQIEFYKSKSEFLTAKLNTRKIPEGKELEEGMRIIDKIEEALSKKYI